MNGKLPPGKIATKKSLPGLGLGFGLGFGQGAIFWGGGIIFQGAISLVHVEKFQTFFALKKSETKSDNEILYTQ